jgi:hypothetical protein
MQITKETKRAKNVLICQLLNSCKGASSSSKGLILISLLVEKNFEDITNLEPSTFGDQLQLAENQRATIAPTTRFEFRFSFVAVIFYTKTEIRQYKAVTNQISLLWFRKCPGHF